MKQITSFQVLSHGVDTSSYFQGCGVAFSDFENVQTGIGDTEREAFNDALDQIVSCGAEISPELEAERENMNDSVLAYTPDGEEEQNDCCETPVFWVSVRYNVAK